MDWNDNQIGQLRVLWDQGISTAEIGRMMGVSKNAIVGKVHRLDLPARPPPISRKGEPKPYPTVRRMMPRRTLPPLVSEADRPIFAGEWITPERIEILKRDVPTHRARLHILAEMAELPGPLWSNANTVSEYARNVLGLHRPDDFRPISMVPRVSRPGAPKVPQIRVAPAVKEAPVVRTPQVYTRVTGCCFPLGDVGTPGFRFCDEPHRNKSYCDVHAAACYARAPRDWREDVTYV